MDFGPCKTAKLCDRGIPPLAGEGASRQSAQPREMFGNGTAVPRGPPAGRRAPPPDRHVHRSGRLDELVRDVSGEFVASYPLPGRVRFRCVQYIDATGRVALDWGFALLMLPVGVTGFATMLMFVTGARIRRAAGTDTSPG